VSELSALELLTTTRAVRKRLDFDTPVPSNLVLDCLEVALQAPSANNRQHRHFLLLTDPKKKSEIGELYRRAWLESNERRRTDYLPDDVRSQGLPKLVDSARYLADNLSKVPLIVIACAEGRADPTSSSAVASQFASIYPAVWSFMLAARSRGLGTVLTTVHLTYERECAEILEIPYDSVTQAALIPVAFHLGRDFRPAKRIPMEPIVHRETW